MCKSIWYQSYFLFAFSFALHKFKTQKVWHENECQTYCYLFLAHTIEFLTTEREREREREGKDWKILNNKRFFRIVFRPSLFVIRL